MKDQRGQIYQTSYYPYIFKFSLFYFTIFGFITFLVFIWFDDFRIISKGYWSYSFWFGLWFILIPNVYSFLILIGFISLCLLNFVFGRRYSLSENGFYYRWFFSKEFFIPWNKVKSIKIKNDFGYWRIILKKKLSRSFFHLFGKSFFFRVNVPMSCELKREIKRYLPPDLQPKFPKQSFISIISERMTTGRFKHIDCFFSNFKKSKNNTIYYNNHFFYLFKYNLLLWYFIWAGFFLHILIEEKIYNLKMALLLFGPIFFMSFFGVFVIFIGKYIYLFFTYCYKLTETGFYHRWFFGKKQKFISWEEIEFIRVFDRFGFLNFCLIHKECKKGFSYSFLIKKNIGEDPEMEIKKYIPPNVKIKYSEAMGIWHLLKEITLTFKNLFFKKDRK